MARLRRVILASEHAVCYMVAESAEHAMALYREGAIATDTEPGIEALWISRLPEPGWEVWEYARWGDLPTEKGHG